MTQSFSNQSSLIWSVPVNLQDQEKATFDR